MGKLNTLRDQILSLVQEYYEEAYQDAPFIPEKRPFLSLGACLMGMKCSTWWMRRLIFG